MWSSHNTLLVLDLVVAVLAIVVLVARYDLHAFLALMIASLGMGLVAGLGAGDLVDSFESGVGAVLGNVGLVLALGTMLGKLLAESGGAERLAAAVIESSGPRRLPWAMALVAVIIGIPLFFEIGLVLLIPIILVAAQRAQDADVLPARANAYLFVGIPALAGLSVLHGLVPPHPGPLVAIGALHGPLGLTMLYGIIIAIPTVIIAGPLFGRFAMRWADAEPPRGLIEQIAGRTKVENPPGLLTTLFTVLLPVILMLLRT